jgi:hypothetical protein
MYASHKKVKTTLSLCAGTYSLLHSLPVACPSGLYNSSLSNSALIKIYLPARKAPANTISNLGETALSQDIWIEVIS